MIGWVHFFRRSSHSKSNTFLPQVILSAWQLKDLVVAAPEALKERRGGNPGINTVCGSHQMNSAHAKLVQRKMEVVKIKMANLHEG